MNEVVTPGWGVGKEDLSVYPHLHCAGQLESHSPVGACVGREGSGSSCPGPSSVPVSASSPPDPAQCPAPATAPTPPLIRISAPVRTHIQH